MSAWISHSKDTVSCNLGFRYIFGGRGSNNISVAFWPKMYNLVAIVKKHQTKMEGNPQGEEL